MRPPRRLAYVLIRQKKTYFKRIFRGILFCQRRTHTNSTRIVDVKTSAAAGEVTHNVAKCNHCTSLRTSSYLRVCLEAYPYPYTYTSFGSIYRRWNEEWRRMINPKWICKIQIRIDFEDQDSGGLLLRIAKCVFYLFDSVPFHFFPVSSISLQSTSNIDSLLYWRCRFCAFNLLYFLLFHFRLYELIRLLLIWPFYIIVSLYVSVSLFLFLLHIMPCLRVHIQQNGMCKVKEYGMIETLERSTSYNELFEWESHNDCQLFDNLITFIFYLCQPND